MDLHLGEHVPSEVVLLNVDEGVALRLDDDVAGGVLDSRKQVRGAHVETFAKADIGIRSSAATTTEIDRRLYHPALSSEFY